MLFSEHRLSYSWCWCELTGSGQAGSLSRSSFFARDYFVTSKGFFSSVGDMALWQSLPVVYCVQSLSYSRV